MQFKNITLNLFNGQFSPREEAAILGVVAERLQLNECPDKSTVEFHFERLVRRKAPRGIYLRQTNTRAIPLVIVYDGNKGAQGFLKPIRLGGERKMTLKELSEFLKTPVRTIVVKKAPDEEETTPVQKPQVSVEGSHKENIQMIPYTRPQVLNEAFLSLFSDLVPILFKESGKTDLATRDIVDLANNSKESFFEEGRCVTPAVLGHLMSRLAREGVVVIANDGRPFALYRLPEKISSEKPLQEASEVDKGTGNSSLIGLDKVSISSFRDLLASKEVSRKLLDDAEKELSSAKLGLITAQEKLKQAEENLQRSKNNDLTIDGSLEEYRELYKTLGQAFA